MHSTMPVVRVAKLDTEAQPSIAARFAVRSIPTLAVFNKGRLIQQRAGAVSLATLLARVRNVIPGAVPEGRCSARRVKPMRLGAGRLR